MWKNFLSGLLVILFISCSTAPPASAPDWIGNLPEQEGLVYILYNGRDFEDQNALTQALAEAVLEDMGIPYSEEQADLYLEWRQQLQEGIDNVEPGYSIERSESYLHQNDSYIAILLSMDKELYLQLQKDWVSLILVPSAELQEWEDRGNLLMEQGYYGSAFLAFTEALEKARELNNSDSSYRQTYFRDLAMESLSLLTLSEIESPDEVFSGENFSDPFVLRVDMDPLMKESMLFRVSYPHPMDPRSHAQAKVWTDETGQLSFLHPPVFEEGEYTVTVIPDRDFIAERLALDGDENFRELDALLVEKEKRKSYTVTLDKKRIPILLLLEDRDILGKTVEGRESSRKLQVLLQEKGITVEPINPDLVLQGVTERQILREVLLEAPDPNRLLLLGHTQIVDFQTNQNRVTITGELRYKILDLRTFKTLDEGSLKKQLDFDNAEAALSGLYTQLSREMALRYTADN